MPFSLYSKVLSVVAQIAEMFPFLIYKCETEQGAEGYIWS